MSIIKYFLRLQYIDYLIRMSATGDMVTLARKSRLSRSGLANVLRDMKDMGFPIKYDKSKQSYLYTKDGGMVQGLFLERDNILTRNDLKNIGNSDAQNLCFNEIVIFELCQNL